ncbi:MAG: NAD(P)H-dependent oxidoreductase [Bacteroidota bacterium]
MRKVIILGSARKDGETRKVVSELMKNSDWNLVNLIDFDIAHFDYEHLNRNDDFLPLIKDIIEKYEVLIFATPVYWYAMSGIMKVFFDRLTDLLRIEKETGRKLRNKYMAVISSSNGDNLEEYFWLPFKKSAAYLGMNYIADLHTYQFKFEPDKIAAFKRTIEEQTTPNP